LSDAKVGSIEMRMAAKGEKGASLNTRISFVEERSSGSLTAECGEERGEEGEKGDSKGV